MRVAALYDVHGNLPALEAALAEVRAAGAHHVVVGGDVVPGPMPAAAMDALLGLDLPTTFIRGNGEADVLAAAEGRLPDRVPSPFRDAVRWVAERLRPEHLEAMAHWPLTAELDLDPLGRILFCHATPASDSGIVTERTPEDRLHELFGAVGADVVVCGHTHVQFHRRVGPLHVVNAGSVGFPFGRAGAHWLLLGDEPHFRHTTYDVRAAGDAFRAVGYPDAAFVDPAEPPDASRMLARLEAAGEARSEPNEEREP